MHLDVEQLERLLADELPQDAAAARAHIAACAECAARLQAAANEQREVEELMRQVDQPTPRISVEALRRTREHKRTGWGARAAGVALVAGAAAVAYALPGSPLRKWLNPGKITVESPAASPEPVAAGIAVDPENNLVIAFAHAQSTGFLVVTFNDSSDVAVQARGGAAVFSSEAGRLLIDNRDQNASFEIRVPRNAPRVEIRVADRRAFLKDGSNVSATVSAVNGSYRIPLQH